ncbi:cache domain-containing sensor histidine kinase [Paenibacillus piri]|uniref:histidine kinase n=1 Tax=Paenibacillus piri TaxID=2547395 RepID=A0A4R5KYY0_9BACL|nr:sensor histidine kinase [Paenibacillus piri]TDG00823.1 sensor histidine kinase [Paenibacillus piri]
MAGPKLFRIATFNRLHSIALQLFLLFFVSILIPVLIGGYLSYEKSARMIEDQVSNVASLTIKQVRDNLNFVFKGLDNTSMRLLSNKTIQEALQSKNTITPYDNIKLNTEAKDFLISLMMNMPEVMDIYILDINRQNSVVSSPLQSVMDPWKTEWYEQIIKANGPTVWFGLSDTSYLKGINMGIPVFGLGRTIKDVDTGKIIGVMFIEARGKILTETLDAIQFGQTGYAYMIDQSNRFVYHRDSSLYSQASDLILPNRTQVTNIRGRDMMVIPSELDNGWRVAGIVPVQELVASSMEIRDLTVWIALASAIVAVIIGFFVTHKIGQPLIHLSKLMKRSEAGDLSVRFNITGKNEIGQLGQSFNKMIRQIDVLIQRIAKEENEKKKAEIRAMRYQINPHFLYNTLNSIRWMAKLQRTEDVANAITNLVHLLEASLERSGSIVKLGEELELLEKYMVIQQYRYNNGIALNIHSPRELADLTLPRMLLQPIVENAIFHGIAPKEDEGSIEITVSTNGNNAVIVIKDDGMGIEKDKVPQLLSGKDSTKTTGMTRIGLFHVHQTLQLYYGASYGVQVESKEGHGTSVTLTFPIKKASAESEYGTYFSEGDKHEHLSGFIGR